MSLPPILPGVRAAGVLPYRVIDGTLQVALVHRPRYDDWSWPKGKLDRGEDWAAAAVRETLEETGLVVRLGMPLPVAHYRVGSKQDKLVRYWAAEVINDTGKLEHEIDQVTWLSPTLAERRLSYGRDRDQLEALHELHQTGALATWPLLIVRHAHAVARSEWDGPDPLRPLSPVGVRRATKIVTLLEAYAPTRVVSSTSVRCLDTMAPFAERHGPKVITRKGLSEEGFAADPAKLDRHLAKAMERAVPTAVCTHGPLLPRIVDELWRRASTSLEPGHRRMLARLVDVPLDKGEILACQMLGSGEDARVVAVERHRPPA